MSQVALHRSASRYAKADRPTLLCGALVLRPIAYALEDFYDYMYNANARSRVPSPLTIIPETSGEVRYTLCGI